MYGGLAPNLTPEQAFDSLNPPPCDGHDSNTHTSIGNVTVTVELPIDIAQANDSSNEVTTTMS